MYDDDGATLSVGFTIETGDSFAELDSLDRAFGSSAANAIREMQRIEQAVGMPIAKLQELVRATQGTALSQRELTRERNLAERSGDKLSQQMAREIANYGKSRAEIQRNKLETAALRSERAGLTVQSGELLQQLAQLDALHAATAASAAQEAQAMRGAANAHLAFEAAARRGIAAMREQEAAAAGANREAQQIAAAAERLRGSIDPAYAAQSRFNKEMQEAQTLISRGAISLDDYTAKLRMERAALDDASAAQGQAAASVGAHRAAMSGLSFQAQDAFTQISMGANPLNVLAIQGGQAAGQMAFLGGRLGAVANFMIGPWGLALTGGMLLLGSLTKGMLDSAEAAKTAQFATSALGDAQNILGGVMDLTTGKINTQSGALHALAQAQMLVARVQAQTRAAEAKREIKAIQDREFVFDGGFGGGINIHRRQRDGRDVISQGVLGGTLEAKKAVQQLDQLRRIGRMSEEDWLAATMAVANYGVELENIKQFTAGDRMLNGQGTAGDRAMFLKPAQASAASAAKAKGLSDEQRAYEGVLKAAKDYAAAQIDETARLGLNAKELRRYADAAAIAKAPTDALKMSIIDAAAARERAYGVQSAKDFEASVMKPLRDELALYGLAGPARAAAALGLEKQAFMAAHMADGLDVATARWKEYYAAQSALIDKDANAALDADRITRLNEALGGTAETWDLIARNVENASRGMSDAFGSIGGALGDLASIYANFEASRAQGHAEHIQRLNELKLQADKDRETARFTLANSTAQVGAFGDMTAAAKGFFKEKSAGWKAIGAAEKVFRTIEFAMSVRSMVQNLAETTGFIANSAAKATAAGAEGIANQSKLPFPFNIAAMAATGAALVAAGIAVLGGGGGGRGGLPETNKGTGTVLGDPAAQSESLKRAIGVLADIDTQQLSYSRQMAASLKTIESQIGGFASLLVRNSDSINASGGITEGFNANAIGKVLGSIPLVGGILKGLFGTKTTVTASGLYGGAQSLGDILSGGYQADYFTDVEKKKKLFGFTTGTKYSTSYTGADPMLENQFTLILKQFNDAIAAAAGPLGSTASEIQQRLNGFTVSLGKIDLKGLTGEQIQEKLSAVFGSAADSMARTAFPFIDQFQKVGEGAFETLVRVSSTIEAVGSTLGMLGQSAQGMGIAAKLGLADQFESVSALTTAVDAYFAGFYTKEEQAAARTAQMGKVFESLGLTMPGTLATFRQLVEAQNLNTAAGRETYATLLKLAPAFADLQAAMLGAKSAADIASERTDLERQMLELRGDTAALRALQLGKLDASNRALQQEIWTIQDANAAAKAAEELRKAWSSVGDSIMDEVRRIRGLTDAGGGNSFASLMGQFNMATSAARAGDMDAAKSLPGLSKALLDIAGETARSRQELDRIRAQAAVSLEATYGLIGSLSGTTPSTNAALLNAVAANQPGTASVNANNTDALVARIDQLTAKIEQMRAENTSGLVSIAGNTGKVARTLEIVTSQSGGDAVSIVASA